MTDKIDMAALRRARDLLESCEVKPQELAMFVPDTDEAEQFWRKVTFGQYPIVRMNKLKE